MITPQDDQQQLIRHGTELSMIVAKLVHDFRSPLTGIEGALSLLLRMSGEFSDRQRSLLTSALSGTQALERLMSQTLSQTCLHAKLQTVESRRFCLRKLAQEVTAILSPQALLKELSLRWHVGSCCPRLVMGDEGKIYQVLLNLAGNALKFTRSGKVEIQVDYQKEQQTATFLVSDTGCGIKPADFERIFEPFVQINKQTGVGLGLANCKGLIELMKGSIGLQSEQGKGSTFFVKLTLPETA